jgi:hypothetical protein
MSYSGDTWALHTTPEEALMLFDVVERQGCRARLGVNYAGEGAGIE